MRRPFFGLFFLLLGVGCTNYAVPHHTYAPLLNAAEQAEATVSVGGNLGAWGYPSLVVEGRGAVSPVDAFVVAGGVSSSVISYEEAATHVDGELAFGFYLPRRRSLRAEVLLGAAGGYGTGFFMGDGDEARVEGPYARPFMQGNIAGVYLDGAVTVGGGLRVAGTVADLQVSPVRIENGPPPAGFAYAIQLAPSFLLRFAVPGVAFDLGFGTDVAVHRSNNTIGQLPNVWLQFGVHLRFDQMASGTLSP